MVVRLVCSLNIDFTFSLKSGLVISAVQEQAIPRWFTGVSMQQKQYFIQLQGWDLLQTSTKMKTLFFSKKKKIMKQTLLPLRLCFISPVISSCNPKNRSRPHHQIKHVCSICRNKFRIGFLTHNINQSSFW